MKIGILSKNYAAKRLFLNKISDAEYKDIRFFNYYLWKNAHLWFLRMIGKLNMTHEEQASKLFYKFKALFPTGCEVFHFFNTINHSKTQPWVVSVESAVPWPLDVIRCVESKEADLSSLKNNQDIRKDLYYLSLPNCLGLIALSKCSKNIQLELLKQFPEYENTIKNKLVTVYPPQQLFIKSVEEKGIDYSDKTELTFIFVGTDFFRKGGREIITIMSKLHQLHKFKLILISSLRIDEPKYIQSDKDIEHTKKQIKDSSWIEYHEYLTNDKVIESIKRSHVALLPTWMDTYGYSVLECQACGTPVISTSLRALTETNDNSVGWLIEVPVNKLNNPLHNTKEEQDIFSSMLQKGLHAKIEHILSHHSEIQEKAQKCIERIKKFHNPHEYNEKLSLIYTNRIHELKE